MVDTLIQRLYGLAREGKLGSNKILDRTIDSFLAAKAKNAQDEVLCRILSKGIRQIRASRVIEKRVARF